MDNVEVLLTEILNSKPSPDTISTGGRYRLINDLAGVLIFAESGMVSDQTIRQVKNKILEIFPNESEYFSTVASNSFAVLMDFFLTDDEILQLLNTRPTVVSNIIKNNLSYFSDGIVKTAVVLSS